jgi:NADH dehydrogenase FAD-containing subunit
VTLDKQFSVKHHPRMTTLTEYIFLALFKSNDEDVPITSSLLEEVDDLVNEMRKPKTGVVVKDRRYRFKPYPKCFVASECVTWLCDHLKIEKNGAVKVGLLLQRLAFIDHVTSEHKFKDESLFFRWSIKKRIVVVGGGYAGSAISLAFENDPFFEVTLVDPKPHFENILAFPQLFTDAQRAGNMRVPHVNYLQKSRVIYDRVNCITPSCVPINVRTDANGNDIPFDKHNKYVMGDGELLVPEHGDYLRYDYLVVGTGSRNAVPFPVQRTPVQEGETPIPKVLHVDPYNLECIVKYSDQLAQSKKIVVIGAGAVGIEVAGEIAEKYKDKQVLIVTQRDRFLERLKENAHKSVVNQLSKNSNVKVIYGARVVRIIDNTLEYVNVHDPDEFIDVIDFDDKVKIVTVPDLKKEVFKIHDVDIVVIAVGQKPNTELFRDVMEDSLSNRGFVSVNMHFQVSKNKDTTEFYDNIFAVGDIADTREEKMAQMSEKHATHVIKVIKHLDDGGDLSSLDPYKSLTSPFMIISLGPNRAITIKGTQVLIDGALSQKIKSVTETKKMRTLTDN